MRRSGSPTVASVLFLAFASATTSARAADYADTILRDGAAPFYRLDDAGGPIARDSSARALHGAYSSDGVTYRLPSLLADDDNPGVGLDGETGGLAAPPSADTNAYSVEGWFYPFGLRGFEEHVMIVRVDSTGHFVQELVLWFDLTHYWFEQVVVGSEGQTIVTGTTMVQPNTIYHVVATAAAFGMMRLYVNGVEEGTPLPIGTFAPGVRWQIGLNGDGGWGNFYGRMDDVAIYDRELSPEQIRQHYLIGAGLAPTPSPTPTPAAADSDGCTVGRRDPHGIGALLLGLCLAWLVRGARS